MDISINFYVHTFKYLYRQQYVYLDLRDFFKFINIYMHINMKNSIIGNHFVYFFGLYLSSYILSKNSNLAKVTIPILSLYLLFTKRKQEYTSLFIKIKALLVLLPIIIYPYYNLVYTNEKSTFFTTVLMLNILEVAILLCFKSDEILSNINGLTLLALALLTPQLNNYNSHNVKFDNNYLWSISYSIMLSSTYLFNDYYYKDNWRYSGIYSVLIPSIHMLFTKSCELWIPLRIYSLIITFFIDSTFPSIHDKMVVELNRFFLPSTQKYDTATYKGT